MCYVNRKWFKYSFILRVSPNQVVITLNKKQINSFLKKEYSNLFSVYVHIDKLDPVVELLDQPTNDLTNSWPVIFTQITS